MHGQNPHHTQTLRLCRTCSQFISHDLRLSTSVLLPTSSALLRGLYLSTHSWYWPASPAAAGCRVTPAGRAEEGPAAAPAPGRCAAAGWLAGC